MATSTSTVKTVPPWAEEYVVLYAERARTLGMNLGTEPRTATAGSLATSWGAPELLLNPELAYDGLASTYALMISHDDNTSEAIYSGFTAAVETYTQLQVRVTVGIVYPLQDDQGGSSQGVYYSTDGGSTWTLIYAGYGQPFDEGVGTPMTGSYAAYGRTPPHTLVADLPVGTDLTQVQVKLTAHPRDSGLGQGWTIYEVQTAGYYALPDGAPGSLQVYSGAIFAAQNQDEIDGIDGLATRGRYGDQVITKAIAYEDDVINGGHLAGTKAELVAALASVTGNSTSSFAAFSSRIGRKPFYVGDSDSTFLAQTFVTGVPTTYNARMSALIYADNFHKERDIQDHALGYGVEMGKHAAIDAETLRRAGLYQREYVQYGYTMSHKLFLEEQELAVVNLEIFGNCLRALTGSQQTTTQEYAGGNKVSAAVGMGVAGGVVGWYAGVVLGAEGGVWGGPVGMAVGAIVGGVLGYVLS